jgi:hypothetical protein
MVIGCRLRSTMRVGGPASGGPPPAADGRRPERGRLDHGRGVVAITQDAELPLEHGLSIPAR